MLEPKQMSIRYKIQNEGGLNSEQRVSKALRGFYSHPAETNCFM